MIPIEVDGWAPVIILVKGSSIENSTVEVVAMVTAAQSTLNVILY